MNILHSPLTSSGGSTPNLLAAVSSQSPSQFATDIGGQHWNSAVNLPSASPGSRSNLPVSALHDRLCGLTLPTSPQLKAAPSPPSLVIKRPTMPASVSSTIRYFFSFYIIVISIGG